ncbi:MAG TPA: TonB-dependent receptor, partial [Cytophagales bacterium]|nr:TonB-dependent receptor [Cytophagales bacterium]
MKDSASGEDLIGAIVSDKEADAAIETNEYGFYSLSVPSGKRIITVEYPGYSKKTLEVDLQQNQTINFVISEPVDAEVTVLKDVVLTDKKPDDHVNNIKMSTNTLDIKQIKTLPALFGEVDIIKNIQTLPGVQTAGEGTTGYFVRGGGSDQNLILLDEAPVYNGSHIMGFFSVFNSEAIKTAELYKGAIPAQYGGRLSSLLDIRSKDGNNKRYSGGASLGLISGKFNLEGPIKKDRSSFILSGRRSWADMFLKLSPDADVRKNKLYFYDLNAKVNYQINDKNRIFVAGYFGRDMLKFNAFGIGWGNATGTVRWNHIFSSKVFSNTTFIFSNFDYKLELNTSGFGFDWTSNLKEVGLKQDFNIFSSNKIELNTGFQLNYRYFQPGKVMFTGLPGFKDIVLNDFRATEEAMYINVDYKLNAKWHLQYGTRITAFQHIGKAKVNQYVNN